MFTYDFTHHKTAIFLLPRITDINGEYPSFIFLECKLCGTLFYNLSFHLTDYDEHFSQSSYMKKNS